MATEVVFVAPSGRERVAVVNEGPLVRNPGFFVGEVERWRRELGLTNNAFADYLGVSRGYWSRVRRGVSPVTMALVNRVLRERPMLAYALSADAAQPN